MKFLIIIPAVSLLFSLTACSQNAAQKQNKPANTIQVVGGGCDGCEAIYQQAPSFDDLGPVDTLPDFNEAGPKIRISGIVYQPDERTPAKNVVIYVYHTDQTGHYTAKGDQSGAAKRHGYIRGWMRTNARGEYKFYTLMPGHYPGTKVPAHIHVIIKEADKNEYWIDEYLFDDDPSLTTTERKKQESRGGIGIVVLKEKDGMLNGERNIYLGKNIPGYPKATL